MGSFQKERLQTSPLVADDPHGPVVDEEDGGSGASREALEVEEKPSSVDPAVQVEVAEALEAL